MRMKRSVVAACIVTAAVAVSALWLLRDTIAQLAGGSPGNGTGIVIRGPGEFPIANERIKLSMFVSPAADTENLETNLFTKYVEDKLGIEFQFIAASAQTLQETKQVMFAGGDYPPVIMSGNLTPDEQIRYGRQGILRPLNGLIERYGDRIKEIFRERPDLQKAFTAPDGNIYALPSVNDCLHCWYAQKLWINTAWLKKLNLSMPETTEELYRVLRAFKREDPNGNGLHDEIPLSGAMNGWHSEVTGFLMSAFIYNTDTNYFYIKDGKVGMAAAQPQWRHGLEYMHKLFSEGLIDPAVFTQTIDGLVQSSTRKENVLGSATLGHIRMAFGSLGGPRHRDYDTVPPLIGPDGYQAAGYFNMIEDAKFAITDKATETEAAAAFRLADFLLTEEAAIRNEWGPEGVWWRPGRPGEKDEHGRPAKYWLDPQYWNQPTQNAAWSQMGLLYRDRNIRESWAVPNDPYSRAGYEHRLYKETVKNYLGKQPDEVYPSYIFMNPEEADEAAKLRMPINEYIESNMVQFITGAKDTEADWDDYVRGLQELKLDRYLAIHQKAYNEYRNK